ncbi:Kel3p [Kluyveromyces lactis]|uniref:KLLA0D00836p n=1 Tax=Kluyveromyces lactis (strain ATCC 8585 / CBS 2359 / DSM 70799 / NBRC 1267 / NRRL Y-1140 / WM37) TaxID=284590 RepID=Q6CSI0_KLULA|nr:uncharacterized protein KLLA0_D00836g [Kluyveromyces lactis]CAH00205.1 KLLA0D00836p [Kluyveromyces lactis]|eukprot:XP_453109.1 uncharacterized protein KLLA0_D00836g [Kluyveromyces lactis]
MAKKKDKESKKARTEAKNKKALEKAAVKDKKKAKKLSQDEEEDDMDIEEMLANFKREQENFEKINVENVDRPDQRINPCMFVNPAHGKRELMMFGGESTTQETGTTHFYNDLFVYSLDTDTWKRYTSQNSPMPRSSAAVASHPTGVALIHGGEFSSPKQNTFYHYSDSWLFDCSSKEWTKVEQKNGPSARSGHRMAIWKNFIILHGGFRDLGTSTTYLNDLWVFDITNYKWKQVELPANHPIPDARSGHSLISTAEGAVLYGGYTKVKAGKGLQKGKILSDCWYLKMKSDLGSIRWERRKKQGSQPSPRVGCSMVHHKGRGVLFGGVYDFEETEESLRSIFYNELYTYQIENNRWYAMSLRPQRKKKNFVQSKSNRNKDKELEDILNQILDKANLRDAEDDDESKVIEEQLNQLDLIDFDDDDESDKKSAKSYETMSTLPHARFNAATAVVDDTLFIFGGTVEIGEKDYPIDSFYSIDMNKLDGVKVYWEELKEVERAEKLGEQDSDDEFGDEDDDDEDDGEEEIVDSKLEAEDEEEEEEEEEVEEEYEIPDLRPWLPHPKAFETLRAFYVRTGPTFLELAISSNRDSKGKHLKTKSFELCQDRWWERREQVRIEEDKLEELGGVEDVIEKDTSKTQRRR